MVTSAVQASAVQQTFSAMIYIQTKDSFASIWGMLSKILIAAALIVVATGCSLTQESSIDYWKGWIAFNMDKLSAKS